MNYLIFVIFIILLFFSIRKSLQYFPIFILLSPSALLLIQTTSLPLLSVINAIVLSLFIISLLAMLQNKLFLTKKTLEPFMGFIPLLISYVCVFLYSNSQFSGMNTMIMIFFSLLLPSLLYVNYFQEKKVLYHINEIKFTFIILFILGLYATISLLVGINLYADLIDLSLSTDLVKVHRYIDDWRGERAIGTLSHPITYGAFIAIGFFCSLFLALFYSQFKSEQMNIYIFFILSLFMIIFIFMSNSRTPLLFVLTGSIILLFFLNIKYKILIIFISVPMIFIFLQFDFFYERIYGILNLFDQNIGEDQRGSSIAMRLDQLSVSYDYFMKSPFFGNGFQTTRHIVSSGTEPNLYNAESILFKILIDMGLVGILGYMMFFIFFYWLIYKIHYVSSQLKGVVYAYISGYIFYIIGTGVMNTMQIFIFVFYLFYLTLKSLENHNKQFINNSTSKKTCE